MSALFFLHFLNHLISRGSLLLLPKHQRLFFLFVCFLRNEGWKNLMPWESLCTQNVMNFIYAFNSTFLSWCVLINQLLLNCYQLLYPKLITRLLGTLSEIFMKITLQDLCNGFESWTVKKAAAAAKLHKSCPTLCDPIDGSPPGSSIPGFLQARILERVAISFS